MGLNTSIERENLKMSSDPGAGDIFSKLRAKFRGDEDIDGQRKLNKILNKLSDKGYFSNSYDNAILQTDIASKISLHFTNNSGTRKKAILITIDGFRAEGLEYMMGNDLGMLSIAKEGGLYWTKPANLDTKANIDIGVNFLSIVTGQEPSTFNVLKKTDAK